MTSHPSFLSFALVSRWKTGWIVLALALAMGTSPAMAQRSDNSATQQRLDRLERDLQDLSRQVYRGGSGAPAGSASDNVAQPSFAADTEVRIQRLETELQKLTGQYEEAAHALAGLRDRLDKMNGDLDYRLNRLEKGEGGLASSAGAESPAASPTAKPPGSGSVDDRQARPDPAATAADASTRNAAATNASVLPSGTVEQEYDAAFQFIRQHDLPQAEKAFTAFLSRHPNDALASNAQYWLAESFYARNDMKNAAVAYAEGYQRYPKGSKAVDSLYKLALSLGNLGRTEDACIALKTLASSHKNAAPDLLRRVEAQKARLKCG